MTKRVSRKTNSRRRSTKKNKTVFSTRFYITVLLLFGVCFTYHYREALLYYFGYKTNKISKEDKVAQARIYQVLHKYKDRVVGFDVSQFQGDIHWEEIDSVEGYKLHFVFVRATAGSDKLDSKFRENW